MTEVFGPQSSAYFSAALGRKAGSQCCFNLGKWPLLLPHMVLPFCLLSDCLSDSTYIPFSCQKALIL